MAIDPKVYRDTTRMADKFESMIEQELFETLTANIDIVKEQVIDSYSQSLTNVVADKRSKTRPEYYLDEFMSRLDEFEYVDITNGSVTFRVPDINNFDFSGRLRVIENILEGVVGQYVEVDGDQWQKLFGKKQVSMDPVDSSLPAKERVYLLKYNSFMKAKEKELNTQFVPYPFSNVGPIDIFRSVNDYVSSQIGSWIDEAVVRAKKRLSEEYK